VSFGERMSTRIFASYLRTHVSAPAARWEQGLPPRPGPAPEQPLGSAHSPGPLPLPSGLPAPPPSPRSFPRPDQAYWQACCPPAPPRPLQGVPGRQHDAWDLGFTTTDDFTNSDIIYEETMPKVKAALTRETGAPRELPIVTGFLGRGMHTGGWAAGVACCWLRRQDRVRAVILPLQLEACRGYLQRWCACSCRRVAGWGGGAGWEGGGWGGS
jgi:hypothetical protein